MTVFKLAEYDLETGNFKGYIEPRDDKKNQAHCFYLDRDNSLFIGSNYRHGGGGGISYKPDQDKKGSYDNGRYILILNKCADEGSEIAKAALETLKGK